MNLLGTQRLEKTATQHNAMARVQEPPPPRITDASTPMSARLRLLLLTIGGLYLPREPWHSIHLSEEPIHADRVFRTWR